MLYIAKSYFYLSFLFPLLFFVLSACNKKDIYYPREDFVNTIKGEWYVSEYYHQFEWSSLEVSFKIIRDKDSIQYIRYRSENWGIDTILSSEKFSISDIHIKDIPGIEKIQNWSIIDSNYILKLKATDLFGVNKKFQIVYSNINYDNRLGDNSMIADIKVFNNDTSIISEYCKVNSNNLSINFYGSESGEYEHWFRLQRPD